MSGFTQQIGSFTDRCYPREPLGREPRAMAIVPAPNGWCCPAGITDKKRGDSPRVFTTRHVNSPVTIDRAKNYLAAA